MNDYQSPFGEAAFYAASDTDTQLDQQFAGKVAIVTGSTQGLGLTAVELMLRRGLKGASCANGSAASAAGAGGAVSARVRRSCGGSGSSCCAGGAGGVGGTSGSVSSITGLPSANQLFLQLAQRTWRPSAPIAVSGTR